MAKPQKINWAKTLDRMSVEKGNEPLGDGWFTTAELMEKCNLGTTRAYRLINKNLNEGKLEMYKGSGYNETHKILSRRIWYRFIDGK